MQYGSSSEHGCTKIIIIDVQVILKLVQFYCMRIRFHDNLNTRTNSWKLIDILVRKL
jgi:hypothetical protein